jgi:hypothetical protein
LLSRHLSRRPSDIAVVGTNMKACFACVKRGAAIEHLIDG